MAFDPLIPAGNVAVNATVTGIQENFSQIKTVFDVNHGALTGTAGDEGKHAKVVLPQQALNPDLLTYAGLFGKASTLGDATALELFLREGVQGATPFDVTSAGFAEEGWCSLPSGILIKWKFNHQLASTDDNGMLLNYTITWATGANIPAFSQVFWADVSLRTKAASATAQMDATAILQSFSLANVRLLLRKRSSFNQQVPAAQAPLRAAIIAIGV